ncbi:hypothetical protein [Ruania zhangjianzhongii]|uniref:hypothetical protein n=2 Tax=Ruania zhangjianzhongii TaxID=2603206 RepID=UPI0011D17FEC|nr:hypothetical protein [Ruania zhangjianzhongii]
MTGLLMALSIVGAIAVLTFIAFLVVGLRKGWQDPVSRRVLTVFFILGGVCAVLGMLVAFTS